MPPNLYTIRVQQHPGSTAQDIGDEPDWGIGHQHRIGFKNRQDRKPGLTHDGEDEEEEFEEKAQKKLDSLRVRFKRGDLLDFRDLINNQEDYHLRRPCDHPTGWRYVLSTTEEWIIGKQDWPANLQKRKQQERHEQEHHDENEVSSMQQSSDEEYAWRKQSKVEDNTKHHDVYATDGEKEELQDGQMTKANGDPKEESEYQKLPKKYSPQEIASSQSLQHET